MNTKEFTILHSNDMHGDFLAEVGGAEGNLLGGLALLSGYVNKVREEEENVLYVISGDMVQGSLIDSEFKGISTIEIMNYIAPDVVTLGNHEIDYGLPHLLFLEKMANFPIVNANMYIAKYGKRLMQPYLIINVAGFDIMFIGIITEAVLQSLKMDRLVGTFISLEDASREVGKICNAYKDEDIDLTVLLTHVGFDSDQELAGLLDPEWGVDMIIGGHSHTLLEKPAVVNDILIVQAGTGTDQIGRFDIVVDDDTNSIVEWEWQLLPVEGSLAEPDEELQKFIDSFKQEVDRKYNAVMCRLAQKLTHPKREEETSLGNLFADIFAERAQADVVFVGSGSIRGTELGPLVTLGDYTAIFPFDDALYKFTITGAQLKQIFEHILRPENRNREGECYQVSRGVHAAYVDSTRSLETLTINGQSVKDADQYSIGLQGYHYENAAPNIGLSPEELTTLQPSSVVTTSVLDVLEEYLRSHQNLSSRVEGRLTFKTAT
ncbi:MAG: bifunctional metallophosphatase/5'-nucleotidase [Anaerolineae bacterium]|nr:bifunctional metallophosphatase/5'-nucleotidase [Anaerolineae bacterium]NIN94641.1 bifunctional metallophosphatase/5'-nucleotidase [Anaerolineae bacterium]NIQ77701.1 bifunctional metallophosphatase/5'-nucleotidase [Anaerolineae bacterium]